MNVGRSEENVWQILELNAASPKRSPLGNSELNVASSEGEYIWQIIELDVV